MTTGYADWRAAVCCGERSGRMDLGNGNQCFLVYTAGMLLLYFCGRLLFVPLKFILKLLICSLAGGVFLVLIRIFGDTMGLFLPINPVNSLIAGVCGVPELLKHTLFSTGVASSKIVCCCRNDFENVVFF